MTRAHGVRGSLVIAVDPSMAGAIAPGKPIELRAANTDISAEVVSAGPTRGGKLVKVGGIDDRTKAETIVGADVYMDADQLPSLGDGEYYEHDLIGCSVVAEDGKDFGTVTEILKTGANDVYVISGDEGEVLAPAVAGVILDVDVTDRRIKVEADGLAYSGTDKKRS